MTAATDPLELAVVGAGYVGLVTAACLAMFGHTVRCIDRDRARIDGLVRGVLPFFEPGLADATAHATNAGRLAFADSLSAAHGSDAALVCVGTLDEAGNWSDHDVAAVVDELAADDEAPQTVILRSTLMPGTTDRLARRVAALNPDSELALNPEFTRQGSAVDDFVHPDRLVFGLTRPHDRSRALDVLRRAYGGLKADEVVTDAATAELIKVGSNTFLALKAGFANELARLAAATGADVSVAVDGIGRDARIGRAFMTPGPGVGGACLPSQARALPGVAREAGVATPIIDAIARSNVAQADWVAATLERAVGDLRGKRVALLGLTFKAGTDDVRESPAFAVCRALIERGATVAAHDPQARHSPVETSATVSAALRGAEAVVITTDWSEYERLNWAVLRTVMTGSTIVDTRNVVDRERALAAGMTLLVHGRPVTYPG